MKTNMLRRPLLFVVLALSLAGPARADTDYQCLQKCVDNGRPEATCMPACTYNKAKPAGAGKTSSTDQGMTAPSSLKQSDTHRLLAAQHQIDDGTIYTPPKTPGQRTAIDPASITASKNYSCVAQCLQLKISYQMCQENCTTLTGPNGEKLPGQQNAKTLMGYSTDKK